MKEISGTSTNLEDRLLLAIRENCIECSGGDRRLAARCVIPECPLYGFRELSGLVENVPQNANEKGVCGEGVFREAIPDGEYGQHETLAGQSQTGTM